MDALHECVYLIIIIMTEYIVTINVASPSCSPRNSSRSEQFTVDIPAVYCRSNALRWHWTYYRVTPPTYLIKNVCEAGFLHYVWV